MTDTNTETTIIARFQITGWEETELPGVTGETAYGAKMTKTFSEGIAGSSEGLFIASGTDEGNRSYIAVERITGTLTDGRSGSFTVHHGGLESDPETWFGHIVPGSGTDDLAGIAGSAKIAHDEQGAFFTIELNG
jgi:hypothetical protein